MRRYSIKRRGALAVLYSAMQHTQNRPTDRYQCGRNCPGAARVERAAPFTPEGSSSDLSMPGSSAISTRPSRPGRPCRQQPAASSQSAQWPAVTDRRTHASCAMRTMCAAVAASRSTPGHDTNTGKCALVDSLEADHFNLEAPRRVGGCAQQQGRPLCMRRSCQRMRNMPARRRGASAVYPAVMLMLRCLRNLNNSDASSHPAVDYRVAGGIPVASMQMSWHLDLRILASFANDGLKI